jgi:hypothetical protein
MVVVGRGVYTHSQESGGGGGLLDNQILESRLKVAGGVAEYSDGYLQQQRLGSASSNQ